MKSQYLLKPCPFCGSNKLKVCKKNGGSEYMNELGHRINRHYFSVRCQVCFARGGTAGGLVPDHVQEKYRGVPEITTDTDLQEEAVRLWNERA